MGVSGAITARSATEHYHPITLCFWPGRVSGGGGFCRPVCPSVRGWNCDLWTVQWERMLGRMNINGVLAFFVSRCRSLPKLSSQDEEGGAGHGFGGTHAHFEPIPHDHDFCERVVINVSIHPLERRARKTWMEGTNER